MGLGLVSPSSIGLGPEFGEGQTGVQCTSIQAFQRGFGKVGKKELIGPIFEHLGSSRGLM